MPRPTVMTGWWKLVLKDRANGRIALLAELCGVTVRTLHRWQSDDIHVPDLQRRKVLQVVAGPTLLAHPECPKYLRFKIVKKVRNA